MWPEELTMWQRIKARASAIWAWLRDPMANLR